MAKKKILAVIKNRFFYTFLVFIIWLGFIDHNSLVKRVKIQSENTKLKQLKKSYIQNIKHTNEEMKALEDTAFLEKLAREKYLMKKEKEDIYIVTE